MLKKEFPYYPNSLKQNMTLLLLWDFFSRYWWTIPIVMFLTWPLLIESKVNFMHIVILYLTCGGPALALWERRRGAISVYETLPISRDIFARILWLEGVVVIPLLFLIGSPLVMAFVSLSAGDNSSITMHDMLMRILLVVVVSTGCASIYAFVSASLHTKKQQSAWIGILYVSLLIGFLFLGKIDMTTIERQAAWSIKLLTAYPVIILFSYFLRNRLLPSYVVSRKPTKKTAPRYPRSQTSFWLQFWARQMGMIVLGLLACVAYSFMLTLVRERENIVIVDPFVFMFFLGVMPFALSLAYVTEMRPLRALPMTATRLSIFLFSIPVINTLCAALLVTIVYLAMGMYDSLWHILAAVCFSLGFSSILYNILVLFGQMALGVVPFVFMFSFMFWGVEILYIVPVVGLATSPLLMFLIQYSSEVYHRRSSLARGGTIYGRR